MINTGSVQGDQRHTGAVLDKMDRDSVDPALHTDTVMIGADDAGCDEGGPVGDPLRTARRAGPELTPVDHAADADVGGPLRRWAAPWRAGS